MSARVVPLSQRRICYSTAHQIELLSALLFVAVSHDPRAMRHTIAHLAGEMQSHAKLLRDTLEAAR